MSSKAELCRIRFWMPRGHQEAKGKSGRLTKSKTDQIMKRLNHEISNFHG